MPPTPARAAAAEPASPRRSRAAQASPPGPRPARAEAADAASGPTAAAPPTPLPTPRVLREPVGEPRRQKRPVARFRLRVMSGEAIAIGPGKIALLEAIADTGSLTAAARQLDMSYRRAWLLLDEINKSLKRPAVDSAKGGQHGGGSTLTETGLEIVALYRGIEATAEDACAQPMKRLLSLIAR